MSSGVKPALESIRAELDKVKLGDFLTVTKVGDCPCSCRIHALNSATIEYAADYPKSQPKIPLYIYNGGSTVGGRQDTPYRISCHLADVGIIPRRVNCGEGDINYGCPWGNH